MRGFHVRLLVLGLASLVLVAGASAAPTVSDAKIEPAIVRPGDQFVITAAVADPAKEVAKVQAVVVQYPEFSLPLNDKGEGADRQAGDGIWSAGADVPSDAPSGTYDIAIWPRDAAGKSFQVNDQYVKAVVSITVSTSPPPSPAGPKLRDAGIEPTSAEPGDHVIITVAVDDPGEAVAKVEAVVQEYPVMTLPLNDQGQGDDKQAGDGVWTLGFDIPDAPAGTYHLDLLPRDAAGQSFKVDDQAVRATVPLQVKAAYLGEELSSEELLAAAKPWRTDAQIAKIEALKRPAGEPFRFVVMGDTRSNPRVFGTFLTMVAGFPKFDFSMNTGDIVPGGQPQEFAFFFTQIKDVTYPFLIVEGNHELGRSGGRLYEELFGPTDYHFDHGGFRFVGLNNARGVVTPQQLAWLDQVLTTNLRKIVFFHAPPGVIKKWAFHAFSAGAEELADLLAEKKVERAYVGHIHGFGVAEYKGVTYVLTGGGGAGLYEQLAPGDFHNIVLVETLPNGLRETVYKVDGSSFVLDLQKWISGKGQ